MAEDARQEVECMGTSCEEAHWLCHMKGKIDFFELFSGSARLSQMAATKAYRSDSLWICAQDSIS